MRVNNTNFSDPASSNQNNSGGGGSPGEKSASIRPRLRALATRTPSLGRCGQCARVETLPQIRKCHFLVTLACLDISSKKRCL